MFAARAVVCTHHRPPPAAHANSGNAARSRCHVEFVDCTHRRRTWKCPPGLKHHTESELRGSPSCTIGRARSRAGATDCGFHCLCCAAVLPLPVLRCRVRLMVRLQSATAHQVQGDVPVAGRAGPILRPADLAATACRQRTAEGTRRKAEDGALWRTHAGGRVLDRRVKHALCAPPPDRCEA